MKNNTINLYTNKQAMSTGDQRLLYSTIPLVLVQKTRKKFNNSSWRILAWDQVTDMLQYCN